MRLIVLIYFTFLNILFSQQIVYELKLPKYLDETSALEYYGGNLLTLNDSGGKSILYEFNFDGVVINQHQIKTVKNYDWESLAADDNFIYVGDFGNNFSNRDNLTILKINIKNFELVGKILISYKNQKKTLYNPLGKFDAEALISYDNKLILFSKNRKDLTSEVYIIPKEIGTYKLEEINSISTDCLITGADYDNDLKMLALVGYDLDHGNHYIFKIKNFDPLNISSFNKAKIEIGKAQIESIKIIDDKTFWLTSEDEGFTKSPRLFKIIF